MNKLSATYWKKKVFQPSYTHAGVTQTSERWVMQVSHSGKRKKITLPTTNQVEAGRMAAEVYSILLREGWDAAERHLNPDAQRSNGAVTVGEWIAHVTAMNITHGRTLMNYTTALRWFARELAGITESNRRFDYKGGGNQAWREQLDAIPLSKFTNTAVQRAIDNYLHRRNVNPVAKASAEKSVRSYVANARGLFSKKVMKRATIPRPDPVPFHDLELPEKGSTRYVSSIDADDLASRARAELREAKPALWIAFLLAMGAGLRRGEMASLTWPQVRIDKRSIWIRNTESFAAKTDHSESEIFLDDSTVEELRRWQQHPDAPRDFVLPGGSDFPKAGNGWRGDEQVFEPLIEWLRTNGVTSNKPLHTLRKEFGSYVAQHGDIFTAQSQLRHAQISTTAAFYAENRRRIAPSFGAPTPQPTIKAVA